MKASILKQCFYVVTAIAVAIFYPSCKKENACDCIKRTGKIIIETRALIGFDKIYVEDNLNVYITQSSTFEVKVEAGENIVPLIKTEVEADGTLTLKNKNRCNWTRSYNKPFNVYVSMPVVKFITSNGTGNIKTQNPITTPEVDLETKSSGDIEMTADNMQITTHMYGYGDIKLNGTTVNHLCSIGGDGYLYASNLVTDYTYLHAFTNGLCYVNVRHLLDCVLDSEGDVYCYGNPTTVQKTQNGSGHLYFNN